MIVLLSAGTTSLVSLRAPEYNPPTFSEDFNEVYIRTRLCLSIVCQPPENNNMCTDSTDSLGKSPQHIFKRDSLKLYLYHYMSRTRYNATIVWLPFTIIR